MRSNRNKETAHPTGVDPEPALRRLRELLRARSLRGTGVREAVVRAAMVRQGHFDAEDLARDLQGQGISRSTIYRSLPLLVEAGVLQPTVSGPRQRYEVALGRKSHDHLVCSRCGAVVEFQFEAFEILRREMAVRYGYVLTGHFHELIGVCPACRGAPAPAG